MKFNANKFIVALGAAFAQAGIVLADGDMSQVDGISIVIAFLGALGVYQVSNQTKTNNPPEN